jgi:hypothetical protein
MVQEAGVIVVCDCGHGILRWDVQFQAAFSFPLLYYNHLRVSSSSPEVVMITENEAAFITLCLEGFFYGKISV